MSSRPMHLAVEAGLWHTEGRWRLPGSFDRSTYFTDPRLWVEMAQLAERGKLDLLFWGEGYGIPATYGGSARAGTEWGVQWPRHDLSTLIPILAWETRHIGFVQTISTSFTHPFDVARTTASLDHVTGGRLGINLINSARTSDFANFGHDQVPPHAARYARMDEFAAVCKALWASVEPEALVLDAVTGRFADPDRVHAVNHRGDHFAVAGPLPVLASPQGRPLLLQAGGSPAGNAFAAKHVDVQYASAGDDRSAWKAMRRQRALLDEASSAVGRAPGDVKLIFDISPVVGETREDARSRLGAMRGSVTDEAALAYLSHNTTFDYATLPKRFTLGGVIADAEAAGGSRNGALHGLAHRLGPDETITREVLVDETRRLIAPDGCVGTAADVAEHLASLHDEGGGDGFAVHLRPLITESVRLFVDGVVPRLQAEGLFRRDYDEHLTLRGRFAE